MINSLKISIIVTISATLFNLFFSIFLYFYKDFKKCKIKKILEFFITLPIFLPPSVLGYILIIYLGRSSFIGRFLERFFDFKILFTINGAILAATIVSLPIVYQNIKVAFDSIDYVYIETGKCLGVNFFQMLIYIYIPLTYNKIISGLLLGFGRAFGEFGATILIAGNIPGRTQTLPLALYSAIESGENSQAKILLITLFTFSSLLLSIYIFFTKKRAD